MCLKFRVSCQQSSTVLTPHILVLQVVYVAAHRHPMLWGVAIAQILLLAICCYFPAQLADYLPLPLTLQQRFAAHVFCMSLCAS